MLKKSIEQTDVDYGLTDADFGSTDAGFGSADAGFGSTDAGFSSADVCFGSADVGVGSADAPVLAEKGFSGCFDGLYGSQCLGNGIFCFIIYLATVSVNFYNTGSLLCCRITQEIKWI